MSDAVILKLKRQPGYVGTTDAAISRIRELEELLRDAREALAWHWETSASIEEMNKQSLLSRIDSALSN